MFPLPFVIVIFCVSRLVIREMLSHIFVISVSCVLGMSVSFRICNSDLVKCKTTLNSSCNTVGGYSAIQQCKRVHTRPYNWDMRRKQTLNLMDKDIIMVSCPSVVARYLPLTLYETIQHPILTFSGSLLKTYFTDLSALSVPLPFSFHASTVLPFHFFSFMLAALPLKHHLSRPI